MVDCQISVRLSGHIGDTVNNFGGMEIPCQVTFSCLRKVTLNQLKALLTKKVLCKLMLNMNKKPALSGATKLVKVMINVYCVI